MILEWKFIIKNKKKSVFLICFCLFVHGMQFRMNEISDLIFHVFRTSPERTKIIVFQINALIYISIGRLVESLRRILDFFVMLENS